MIKNQQKAVIGVIILFVSAFFLFKYEMQLDENTKNIFLFTSIIIALFFINPYIYEIFNYEEKKKDLNLKKKNINKKTILKPIGYVIAFIGIYCTIYDIEYFLLMNQVLVFLGVGLVFYSEKYMN